MMQLTGAPVSVYLHSPLALGVESVSRRQAVAWPLLVAGVEAANLGCPKLSLALTNLDEAREEGERRRDEKERAQGPLVSLPSGVKYRELAVGAGELVQPGDLVRVYYTIYRLNGFYLDSVGYGNEGKEDVGETFNFQYGAGQANSKGYGGGHGRDASWRRRILVRPELGWVDSSIQPPPSSSAAARRLRNVLGKPILVEVELVKVTEP
eukprot:SM000304S11849  [mRNA]  locus=s304:14062:15574:- [translate_table: standard]